MIVLRHQVREALREFREHNLQVERTRGGHLKIQVPGATTIYAPSTASDYRSLLNMRAMIRRALRGARP